MADEPKPPTPQEPDTESSDRLEDEVPTEDHEGAASETQASELATVEVLAEEIEELRAKAAERDQYLDRLQRTTADFINYQKRQQRERERWNELALRDILLKLLPVLDDIERALATGQKDHDAEALLRGFGLIRTKFLRVLADEGVAPLDAMGKPFDPACHQAVNFVERRDLTDHTIVEVARPGFRIGDRILRPAQVVVSRGGPPPLLPAEEQAPQAEGGAGTKTEGCP